MNKQDVCDFGDEEMDRRLSEAEACGNAEGGSMIHIPSQEWDEPLPVRQCKRPAFPVGALPDWLKDFVRDVARSTETPVDLGGMLGLAVLSTVFARKYEVRVRSDWNEPVNLYIVVALPSGENKGPVAKKLVGPIYEFQQQMEEKWRVKVEEADSNRRILEAKRKTLEKKLEADTEGDEEERSRARAELSSVLGEIDKASECRVPQLVSTDVTPEQIVTLLAKNGGRLAILTSEAGIFGTLGGRYSNMPNLDAFLQAYSGEPILPHRVTREAGRVYRPALTLGVSPQPSFLHSVDAIQGFRDSGALARLSVSEPMPMTGYRTMSAEPLKRVIWDSYKSRILDLLKPVWEESSNGGVDCNATYLELEPSAYQRLMEYAKSLEIGTREGGDYYYMQDWVNKLRGCVARLSGLLFLSENLSAGHTWTPSIPVGYVDRGIEIAEYLLGMAQFVYEQMGEDPRVEKAERVLKWIKRRGGSLVGEAEVYEHFRKSIFKGHEGRDAVGPVLSYLCDLYYLRPQLVTESSAGRAGRKPLPKYQINPLWLQNLPNNPDNGIAA